ncbi:MAG: hypothetical protein WCX73_04450 [Candidatus Pacearchaeota archaeon]|jgi:hypothetical protein
MIRENFSLGEMKNILDKYNMSDIHISPHYISYINEGKRDISEDEIKKFISNKKSYFVEKQINGWIRFKMVYEISNKYDLVIVVKEDINNDRKILKVVSAYKTNKKLKEKWEKISKSLMKR